MGFQDEVRGFDADENDFVDPIYHLEIYREFLGEEEFSKVEKNYLKTLNTMEQVY